MALRQDGLEVCFVVWVESATFASYYTSSGERGEIRTKYSPEACARMSSIGSPFSGVKISFEEKKTAKS